ncbi:MBL fold metallo-hydrolase [Haliangium sp.]|uniref:MBL fold metallo-hydrolase n=1 Tax=Haliangium sp. TaxID=2663208 RepID=UPI003D0AFF0F
MKNLMLFLSLAGLVAGCASLERKVVRGKVRDAFESTMQSGSEVEDLGDGLFSYRWLSYRTLFWIGVDSAVVFDPLNRDAAAELRDEIARRAPRAAIRTVIYSHGHRDHASGASVFGPSPTILAHTVADQELRARSFDDVLLPTEVFEEDDHVILLGDEPVHLIRIDGAHTDGLVVSYFPRRRLLYAVDLVWPNQLPPPAAPLSYSGVERALDRLMRIDFDTFVPGHGAIATRQEVGRYQTFLGELRQEFRSALVRHELSDFHARDTYVRAPEDLGAIFFEVEDALRPGYGDWDNFDEAILATVQWGFWSVLTGD